MAAIVKDDQDLDDKGTRLEHGQQVVSEYGNDRLHSTPDEEKGPLDEVCGQEGKERPWTISPYITVPIWISLSGGLIIFNKWIFSIKGFTFPAFLTAYHMLVAMIGTNFLRYTTNLLEEAEKPLPRRTRTNAIVPIAILYSFSLVLSNAAYVRLSVSLVQMIKVCFVFIAIALPFLEGARPFEALPNLGWHILLLNGLVAFALNVSSVLLIRSSGSVVSSLSGVLKVLSIRWVLATLISQDIILIFFSVVLLGSAISLQQICGYGLALLGLIMFKERGRIAGRLATLRSRWSG
ncbi:hypothetical protein JCM24511_10220 [Saitozyma sp. JCM 24511]|nr:hypothetical protein JCM24511_10220 [Saitozyma sp. JCM 24511]